MYYIFHTQVDEIVLPIMIQHAVIKNKQSQISDRGTWRISMISKATNATTVMHASRFRTSLIFRGTFREKALFLPSQCS